MSTFDFLNCVGKKRVTILRFQTAKNVAKFPHCRWVMAHLNAIICDLIGNSVSLSPESHRRSVREFTSPPYISCILAEHQLLAASAQPIDSRSTIGPNFIADYCDSHAYNILRVHVLRMNISNNAKLMLCLYPAFPRVQ